MTNRSVIAIVMFVVLVFAVDALAFDGALPLFLARKAADLIE
ncbi:MAG: hypothetical protein RLZZ528_2965, partial [Pseudomonadota bacterium]